MEFDKRFKDVTSLDGVRYFYHVTDRDADIILEDGLYLVENDIFTTAIEINDEFKENPTKYTLNERGNFYRNNANIILIAVEEDKFDYLLVPTNQVPDNWDFESDPTCYIPSNNIVGYIDTNNLELIENENFELLDELHFHY